MNGINPSVTNIRIQKVSEHGTIPSQDLVAVEEPLEIRLGFGSETREQKSLSVTMRTPGNDFELAIGFLFTEGIIDAYSQVQSIHYCKDGGRQEQENVIRVELTPGTPVDWSKLQRNFYTTSSCGVCGKSSIDSIRLSSAPIPLVKRNISWALLRSLPGKLRTAQRVFEYTGGLHAVGIFSFDGDLIFLREDVGRHNAFDKVVGALLMKPQIKANECLVLVSGRASFELVQKAARAGFPFFAAIGAPSSLAISLAKETGIALIGFLRDQSFNIYTGEEHTYIETN